MQTAPLDDATQKRLRESASEFREAISIFPGSWSSMWQLGKIYQRLGQHDEASLWFDRAFEVNPTQPDVAREAGLAALEAGRYRDGACLFLVAIQSSPGDGGLRANLALAYLLDSRREDALREAELAAKQDPSDAVSANVLRLVRNVQAGRRPQPRSAADLR